MIFAIKAIPNWMTVCRILITPIVAILICLDNTEYGYALALVLYTVASLTDFVDGWMARRLNVVSPFGEMLDPIADKMLIGCALLALAYVTPSGWLFMLPALVILIREFIISGLREYLAKRSFSAPVTVLAKWKTTAQIVAIGFLIGAPGFPGFPFALEIGLVLLWVAAGLTVQTGFGYIREALRHVT
ncbi:CDP-diacylglycerol--glycerol-3-phosphate 3-phosphatidyltransferase [Alphaproteobacteria bacterium]|jgi:CDP-diacylglycerol--glycerol-3-phosphate 3-phosphatidyltransferase|nr:CDP-diacylglycerol--glycerol-3-phosphate 3-phosphatidyltransferase [Alphaproteobacteria bacterium]